jgi:CSLREA domain-containing protein
VAVLALALTPGLAGAATITPNTFNDDFTANGDCSLREAVSLANDDLTSFQGCTVSVDEDDDTIVLTSGQVYNLTLPGVENLNASGDLDILAESLRIESTGPNRATILADGNTLDRVIDIGEETPTGTMGTVTLTDVDLSGGEDDNDAGGAAVRQNDGVLSINRSRITGNNSDGGGAVLRLTGLSTSTSLLDTVITGNTGASGAVFQEAGVNLAIVESAITGHTASNPNTFGGALGKGLSSGTLTIRNSTISGNSAAGGGGGIVIGGGGATTILNSTIAENVADADAGGPQAGDGGGILVTAGTVDIANTIVADNSDGSSAGNNHPDCSGTLLSGGYNLIESTGGVGCNGLDATDVLGQDPDLNPLSGGSTPTHSYPAGAPADNAGNPVGLGSGYPFCLANDQRGFARDISVSRCDIGAYERQPPVLDPIGDKSVQAGDTLAFTVTASDSDVGDVLTFSSPDLPPGATLSPAGSFSWTPTAAQVGSFPDVTINVVDGSLADSEDITITVTAAPPPDTGGGGGTTTTPTSPKKCKKGRKLKKGKCVKKRRKKKK